jgi:hypothetical protein
MYTHNYGKRHKIPLQQHYQGRYTDELTHHVYLFVSGVSYC